MADNKVNEFTVGNRMYKIIPAVEDVKEIVISGFALSMRAENLNACGEEDGKYLLAHQNEIPVELNGNIYFVFMRWHPRVRRQDITIVEYFFNCWRMASRPLGVLFNTNARLLRRVK